MMANADIYAFFYSFRFLNSDLVKDFSPHVVSKLKDWKWVWKEKVFYVFDWGKMQIFLIPGKLKVLEGLT